MSLHLFHGQKSGDARYEVRAHSISMAAFCVRQEPEGWRGLVHHEAVSIKSSEKFVLVQTGRLVKNANQSAPKDYQRAKENNAVAHLGLRDRQSPQALKYTTPRL